LLSDHEDAKSPDGYYATASVAWRLAVSVVSFERPCGMAHAILHQRVSKL